MKNIVFLSLLALAAGALAFGLMRSHQRSVRDEVLLDAMPELSWMKTDLKLDDAQLAAVTKLHLAYRPKCAELCRRISAAHDQVEKLSRSSRGMNDELHAAIREHATTHAECQQAMLEHIYQTAALLGPDQSTRYIEAVLPIALEITRAGNPHHE
ncbi:MAG: periplasmic heavy metal sensor [Verrucomicrobiota bacterium]